VTGRDLFKEFEPQMNADLALASIAAEHVPGYCQNSQDVVLEPYYGQLNYYSPVLVALARECHRPIYQYLANWDHSLGQLQKTRAITPHGEQLLFELGGYAYVWYDASVPAKVSDAKLSYNFPYIDEAYLRRSWNPGDLLLGLSKGLLVIHAGGIPVLMEPGLSDPIKDFRVQSIQDANGIATILAHDNGTNRLDIELNRGEGKVRVVKSTSNDWKWFSDSLPTRDGNALKWDKHASLRVLKGEIASVEPDGYAPLFATGFNKLKLNDPAPKKFPLITIKPTAQHEIEFEVTQSAP